MRAGGLLERMRTNLRADWTIADIERVCRECGLTITAPRRGSHYKIRDPQGGPTLTVPARRPVKPIYVKMLIALADQIRRRKDDG